MTNHEHHTEELKKNKMSVWNIIVLLYCIVAAGAFGAEEMISNSGPGLALLLLAIFPFIWALPISLECAELTSLMPSEGGIYTWCKMTLGEYWGWQVGFWSGITSWLSQAEYCVLVTGYLEKYVDMDPTTEYMIEIGIVLIFTIINLIGLEMVSAVEAVFTVMVIAAFGIVSVVGLAHWQYNPVVPFVNPDMDLLHSVGSSIAIVCWMYCGYECIANMAEEMKNPQVIPKGMIWAQPIIALSFFLPTLAGVVSVGSWQNWSTESGGSAVGFADVLINAVGPWAGIAFVIVAIISNCSMFNSYIAAGSRAFFVLSDEHLFPKHLNKVSKKRGIPHVSIILMACVTIVMCKFSFETLVMATTPLQMFIYILLSVAVVKARNMYPPATRKGMYVIKGGKPVLYVIASLPVIISVVALYLNGGIFLFCAILMGVVSIGLYFICKFVYRGAYAEYPETFPCHEKSRLGIGDVGSIGYHVLLMGILCLAGCVILRWYGVEEGEGFVIFFCLIAGVVLTALGIGLRKYSLVREVPIAERLHDKQRDVLNSEIAAFHGQAESVGTDE